MTLNYVAQLVQELADRGHWAQVQGLGGNTQGVVVSYGPAGELIIGNGDGSLPTPRQTVVTDYPTDGEPHTIAATCQLPGAPSTTAAQTAERVHRFLHTGQ